MRRLGGSLSLRTGAGRLRPDSVRDRGRSGTIRLPRAPAPARARTPTEGSTMRASLRRIAVTTATLVAVLALATAAWAGAPKFHSATSSVNNDGALVVNFDERGLGNDNIDYTLTADATALYACINLYQHRADRHHQQRQHAGCRRLQGLLRRVNAGRRPGASPPGLQGRSCAPGAAAAPGAPFNGCQAVHGQARRAAGTRSFTAEGG